MAASHLTLVPPPAADLADNFADDLVIESLSWTGNHDDQSNVVPLCYCFLSRSTGLDAWLDDVPGLGDDALAA